ncbi:Hypothetical protein BN69_2068 [Methylocystis sp. SC2]|nr:Hypothetical protein BN69_2068 [Methylocystis sp. SC2]
MKGGANAVRRPERDLSRIDAASTPVNRETLHADTARSAHIVTFSCRRVDRRDKGGHDAVK